MIGPVEQTLEDGHWHDEPSKRSRAIVLDLAGATTTDVQEAYAALEAATRVRAEWDYFLAVIGNRVSAREIARRELADGTD
jgi:hypothetical protein